MRITDGFGNSIDRRTVLQTAGATGVAGGLGTGMVSGGLLETEGVTVSGSTEQVFVLDAEPEAALTLYQDETEVTTATADEFGSYVFDRLDPGEGYTVTQTVDGEESEGSEPVRVLPVDYTPPQELYEEQALEEGFQYIETRDGTTLACQVLFPDEFEPPYPTLILADGYEPSVNFVGGDTIPEVVVQEFGLAVVGVNLRGSACSGGRFNLGEPPQLLDGYDVIETVATQDWVEDGVALVGASYSGFTQLYLAATQPPSLKAIVPGHPIGEFYRDTVYPGGLRNFTFAQIWARDRDNSYEPGGTQGDVDEKIDAGDEICERNQLLRLQNERMVDQLSENRYWGGLYEDRGIWNQLDRIDVPTMLVASWQDEQTGGRAAHLFEGLEEIPKRFVGTNGDHYEYISDHVLDKIERFLTYYLREEIPEDEQGEFDDYEDALAAYEAEDPVSISWERDQNAVPRAESHHSNWPPTETDQWELYLQSGGRLAEQEPESEGVEATSYTFNSPGPFSQLISRSADRLQWEQQDDGTSVAFTSDPLETDAACLGAAYLELWIRAEAADTDLQVTLSEVRPDGQEMFVQTGWLRASQRAETDEWADRFRPGHSHREADVETLPNGEFERLRVELFPFGHLFREGSQVRVAVENPGGNRDLWGFQLVSQEGRNEIAHSGAFPSKLVLPLLPDADVGLPDALPPCGDVRHQPCRSATRPEPESVTGTVSYDTDPISETELVWIPEETTTGVTTVTDDSGRYESPIVPGAYTVRADGWEDTSVTVTADTETLDIELTPVVPPLDEQFNPPRDRDGDGLFEDVTGDGELGIQDVQALFDNLSNPDVQENAPKFNFSGTNDSRVTVFDVQALFTRIE